MLPNRIVASLVIGLFIAEMFVAPAGAQTNSLVPHGPDLVITDIDVGDAAHPRLAGVPGRVNITIMNQGDTDFVAATNAPRGWQIFIGLNGATQDHCIERGDGQVATAAVTIASPCYITMTPTQSAAPDGTNASSIPRGGSARYTMMWDADQADVNGSATIYVEIGNLTDQPGTQSCPGPDQPNCLNDRFTLYGVNIGYLGVRAVPQRLAPDTTNANANSAWPQSDVATADACPTPPATVQRICKVRAGSTIVASYLVSNTGTVDDSYTPTLDLSTNDAARNYTYAFAPENFTLGKAQQREVRLSITIPDNETAGNMTDVDRIDDTIVWSSLRSPTVRSDDRTGPGCASDATYCTKSSVPSFIVDFRRGLNATSNETWRQIQPGKVSLFNITLNNTGNADDSYNLTIVNETKMINDSWFPVITSPSVVQKGALLNATIQIQPPAENATNGTYTWQVSMKSTNDTDGTSKCTANQIAGLGVCYLTFTAHVAQTWSMIPLTDAGARVVPGEPVTYHLGIRNKGNGYDNVSLDLQSNVFGWTTQLSDRVIHLTPFNDSFFTLTVTSPPNIPENTQASFFINATASGPIDVPTESRRMDPLESKMTILKGSNMRLDVPVNSSFVDPGANTTFDVTITNVGNVQDNFTIPTPTRPSDWGVDVLPFPWTGLLDPNQQATIHVSLRAPGTATVGEKATAIMQVISSVDPTRQKSVNLEGRVSGPDLFVDSILANSSSPYTGDPLELSVVAGNAGNKAPDKNFTLRVYFVQNGVERVIGEKTYPALSIGPQRRLVETFPWDTTGIEGTGTLLARIDVDNNVAEIDESPASNEASKPITLRTFDIKLSPADGLSARPGEKVTYSDSPNVFTIEYDGNQAQEPVTVHIESEHGWLVDSNGDNLPFLESNLALPRGTPIPVIATLVVPTLPGTAKDKLSITVTPALRPDQPLRASTTTSITDEENPQIQSIVVRPTSAKLGSPVDINVYVQDATGVSSATAYVILPTNETQSVPLAKAGEGRWNASRVFTVAGVYRVTAEASDAADPPNVNRTRVTVGTFTMTPGSAPTIKLNASQSLTIRTGATILLDITDPLGIGRVTYTIKGVSYDARPPDWRIDTSTFPTGPVDITVTAENTYGVQTTQKFSFTVDNTPPGITKVTLTPDHPKANQDTTLTISTEPKVAAVNVLIKRDGQVLQSVNATKKGSGTFEVKFNPPEGDYRIDVTAADDAGNTKLAESAVVFSAKPGSPLGVPAAGLWMVLGAISLVVLLRRRR